MLASWLLTSYYTADRTRIIRVICVWEEERVSANVCVPSSSSGRWIRAVVVKARVAKTTTRVQTGRCRNANWRKRVVCVVWRRPVWRLAVLSIEWNIGWARTIRVDLLAYRWGLLWMVYAERERWAVVAMLRYWFQNRTKYFGIKHNM